MLAFHNLADEARDRKDWILARHLYAEQLGFAPAKAHLWVQYGHALKESGAPRLAECAYRQAIALAPRVSDSYLQLGHLLKVSGALNAAAAAYTAATTLDQKSDAARDLAELIRRDQSIAKLRRDWLTHRREGQIWPIEATLCVDVGDLHSHQQRRPSGIQRVQMGISMALMHTFMAQFPLAFIRYDEARARWVQIPGLELTELSTALTTSKSSRRAALSPQPSDDAPEFIFPDGAYYLLLGAAWDSTCFAREIEKLKKNHRAKIICMVHDAIPVVAPHFSAQGVPERFGKWLEAALALADGFVTSSTSTKFEIELYSSQRNLRQPTICNVRLDVGLEDISADEDSDRVARQELEEALGFDPTGGEFVLCVGTIEPRKNHTTLFSAWLNLERAGCGVGVPRLVCVGRIGWTSQALQSQLEAKINASNLISVATDLSDAALALLYRTCLFTIYPSMHEGWGLPMSESLAFGKLVLAGAHTSLVEAGRDFAEYVDVTDAEHIQMRVRDHLENRGLIESAEHKIRRSYVSRTWSSVAEDFLKAAASISESR